MRITRAILGVLPLISQCLGDQNQKIGNLDSTPGVDTHKAKATVAVRGTASEVLETWLYEERTAEQLQEDVKAFYNEELEKRSDSAVSQIEAILQSVNESGVLIDILDSIADSTDEQNTLINATTLILKNGGDLLSGFNISVNITMIMDSVLSSGLISTVAGDLLLNDDNRDFLADKVGNILLKYAGVAKLLVGLGDGEKLTIDYLFKTLMYTKTKNPKYKYMNEGKQVVLKARGNYDGSFQTFVNNVVNTVVQSQLVSESLDDVLVALNNSNIIIPIVKQVMNDTKLGDMVKYIGSQLYLDGALDNFDLNYYFQLAKKKHYLSDGLEYILTDLKWSPGVAKLFKTMEDNGVYDNVESNLYGPN